jgi:hypothetical protein
MPNLFGFLKRKKEHTKSRDKETDAIGELVNQLQSRLEKGSTSSDYDETLRMIREIKRFEAEGFGDWETGRITECLRTEIADVPAGVVYVGLGPARKETPSWLVYSLINEEGFEPDEFISAIARRHRNTLWWWLEHYANDSNQTERLREFAKDYLLPSCSFCGALRVTGEVCRQCGRELPQSSTSAASSVAPQKAKRWNVPISGTVEKRTDLACQFCGDDNVAIGYMGSHLRCARCNAIYCRGDCQLTASGGCPRCGEVDRWNFVE